MFENYEVIEKLNQFEKHIVSKSNANTQYAFSVVLSDFEFNKLKKICVNSTYFHSFPETFPWCHIKLLTEAYVRIVQNTNIQTTHTSEELSRFLNFQTPEIPSNIWDEFPNSLKKINLIHTRDEGGPWSIVANIRLHAGIPKSRLHEIVEFLKKKYKQYSNLNEAITYLSSFSCIMENMHFSKYVKEAFTEHRTRKMLFSWLLKIIDYIENYNIDDLINNPHIPPHLIDYFITNPIYEFSKARKQKRIKQDLYQGLQYQAEKRNIVYTISAENLGKVNGVFPNHIQKKIVNLKVKDNSLIKLEIKPEDLPLSFINKHDNSNQLFSKSASSFINLLIFDSLGHVLIPKHNKLILNDNEITIISKNVIDRFLIKPQEMDDDWWGWYLYHVEVKQNFEYNFVKPYEGIEFCVENSNFNSISWISDTVIKKDYFCPVFGGLNLPTFSILSEDRNSEPINVWISILNSKKCLNKIKARFKYDAEISSWVWIFPEFTEHDDEYFISVKQYNFQFESDIFIEQECIWLKGFKFEIKPSRPLFPNETCKIILDGISYKKINCNLHNKRLENMQHIEYQFSEKPEDCSPIISINTQNGWCDLTVKLNYISCFIKYHNCIEPLNVLKKVASNYEVKNIIEQDINAKLIILCLNQNAKLSLHSKNEKIKEIIFNNDFRDTKLLCEMKNFRNIFLKNETNNDCRIIINEFEINTWNFKRIYDQMKYDMIYQNSYYGGTHYD